DLLHPGVVPAIRKRFDAEYARLFGLALDGYPVQVLNWWVLVSAPGAKVDLRGSSDGATSPEQAPQRRRSTYLPDGLSFRDDPVSLDIMWSRLINITEECWVTIWRTAFSTIIGEAQDFGCELLDARANSIAHSPRSMPVFNLTLPQAIKALFESFPPNELEDGDVLITNDPWVCAGHLFDLAVVTPVFRSGQMVGLVGSI